MWHQSLNIQSTHSQYSNLDFLLKTHEIFSNLHPIIPHESNPHRVSGFPVNPGEGETADVGLRFQIGDVVAK